MKEQQDLIRDISEIRSMMERSTKFLSLSGWAGIMAGVYALAGAFTAYKVFDFNPDEIVYSSSSRGEVATVLVKVFLLAVAILVLAIGTAFYFSNRKAQKRNETMWNATSRRLLINMSVPLITGGLLALVMLSKGLVGLIAPITLIFYGLSLFVASRYTYEDIKILGLVQVALGLASSYFIGYGLIFWALGFGVAHIVYGIYIHVKYDR
ncbi:hypothetical protein HYN59_15580 [Flavobacterium album]|uniref:Uncharacterized protein n=1 Tax=Flavobacterium album TaxID=2175091 RepID=A0A2S1R1I3_9FLAO|nr:hypothetical protein [Flavobacterium album]AWH86439.1 hypothetical protein HYN59_15580 [Flavobacterium album]